MCGYQVLHYDSPQCAVHSGSTKYLLTMFALVTLVISYGTFYFTKEQDRDLHEIKEFHRWLLRRRKVDFVTEQGVQQLQALLFIFSSTLQLQPASNFLCPYLLCLHVYSSTLILAFSLCLSFVTGTLDPVACLLAFPSIKVGFKAL